MTGTASRLIDLIDRAVRLGLGLLLLAMVAVNAIAAAARYLFGRGFAGSDELMIFATVWVVFLGAAVLERERRHLGFDLLAKLLGPRQRDGLAVIVALGTAVVLALVAWQSFGVVERLAALGQRSMAGGIPMVVPHAALLIGLGLAAIAALAAAARALRDLVAGRRASEAAS